MSYIYIYIYIYDISHLRVKGEIRFDSGGKGITGERQKYIGR